MAREKDPLMIEALTPDLVADLTEGAEAVINLATEEGKGISMGAIAVAMARLYRKMGKSQEDLLLLTFETIQTVYCHDVFDHVGKARFEEIRAKAPKALPIPDSFQELLDTIFGKGRGATKVVEVLEPTAAATSGEAE